MCGRCPQDYTRIQGSLRCYTAVALMTCSSGGKGSSSRGLDTPDPFSHVSLCGDYIVSSDCCITVFTAPFRSVVVGGSSDEPSKALSVTIGVSPYIRNGFLIGTNLQCQSPYRSRTAGKLFFYSLLPSCAIVVPMKDGNIFLARESTIRNSSVKR